MWFIVLVTLAACAGTPADPEVPVTRAPAAQPVFVDAALEQRFGALGDWIRPRSQSFQHIGPDQVGNFYRERWCAGASETACSGGAVVRSTAPGTRWFELQTLFYPAGWPEVFGLVFSMGRFPADGGLGFALHFSEDGRSILGDGAQLSCTAQGPEAETLWLGSVETWEAFGDAISVRHAPSGRALLRSLGGGPAALIAVAQAQADAVAQAAHAALEEGRIQGFDEGPYLDDGLPPVRTPRPLRPAERAGLVARIADERGIRHDRALRLGPGCHRLLQDHAPMASLVGETGG